MVAAQMQSGKCKVFISFSAGPIKSIRFNLVVGDSCGDYLTLKLPFQDLRPKGFDGNKVDEQSQSCIRVISSGVVLHISQRLGPCKLLDAALRRTLGTSAVAVRRPSQI
jgi:hypothetical protein